MAGILERHVCYKSDDGVLHGSLTEAVEHDIDRLIGGTCGVTTGVGRTLATQPQTRAALTALLELLK